MEENKKISQAAGVIGGMTLLSRVFGFIRDMAIAMTFGSSAAADAFFVAFRIPNLQRRLLGEGAITSTFMPVFSEYRETRSDREAWELSSSLFNILTLFLLLSAGMIYIFAPWLITLFAPGFIDDPEKFNLTVQLTQWMAPFLIFVGLAAFCMGVLNTYRMFALPAAAPILLNICMILSIFFIAPHMDQPILGLALGVLIGGLLQFAIQMPMVLRKGFSFSLSFNWGHPGIRKMGKLVLPMVLGLAVYEINVVVDTLLASLLPGGSISYLYYANRLVQLPLGVFGVALGMAILPTLSEQAARKDHRELIQTVAFAVRLILFVTVPATVGLILLRFPIINTLWERGEFSRSSTEGTAIALLFYSLGLCAYAGIKVVVTAFYSLQDTKTPARIAVYSMLLNIVLCLIFMGPLQHGGLALATSIAAMFNVGALLYILRKRFGRIGGRKMLASCRQLALASGGMGLVIYFLNHMFFDPAASLLYRLTVLAGCIAVGVGVFIGLSLLMKNEEIIFLRKTILQKPRAIPTAPDDE